MKITPLTQQQVFDNALYGLRSRNYKPSYQHEGNSNSPKGCKYRSEIGPCAIGLNIPDEIYDPEMDGFFGGSISKLLGSDNAPYKMSYYGLDVLFVRCNPTFLQKIQDCHDELVSFKDESTRKEFFENEMKEIAYKYGLFYHSFCEC